MTNDDERGAGRVADRRAVLRNAMGLSLLPLGAGMLSGCGADKPAARGRLAPPAC